MHYLEAPLFYIFSLVAVISSMVVVTNRRPTYGVLALAVSIISISGLYILLQAYFVAVVQILIYAGAILVLFLFVLMLLGIDGRDLAHDEPPGKNRFPLSRLRRAIAILLSLTLVSELIVAISAIQGGRYPENNLMGTVEAIGDALFTQYLLPFELVSGILLIGILGVVNLAHKEFRKE